MSCMDLVKKRWTSILYLPTTLLDNLVEDTQLAGVHTCWGRWGKDGKADWCEHLGASAIFDNHGGVIDECLTFKKHLHLLCFAIQTEKQSHKKLQQSLVFQTFAKAVEQYLEI